MSLKDLSTFLTLRSAMKQMIIGCLQVSNLDATNPIVLNKSCCQCILRIQSHSFQGHEYTPSLPDSGRAPLIAKIVLKNMNTMSYNSDFHLELNSMFFQPICTHKTRIGQLEVKFENELYMNELLWGCVSLESLDLSFERIVSGFSFMRGTNLHGTLRKFKIYVKEKVNCRAQSLNEILELFTELRVLDIKVDFTEDIEKNAFLEIFCSSLESLTIDSNALGDQYFKYALKQKKLTDIDIKCPESISTICTMTILNDLAALEVLTNLTLDQVRNVHEWKIVENYRYLLSLDIKSPIDFQLQMDSHSQLCRTLKTLFISFDSAVIQHVRLTFTKLECLSLEITSKEGGNTDINEAVDLFMQANFLTGINKSLKAFILHQDSLFDLMPITMFEFPVLTDM